MTDPLTPETGAAAVPDLAAGAIELHGRVMPASNATFVGEIDGIRVVYKPVAGERPLWDFPYGTLADRERAAYLVSEAFGWDVVPETWLRDGPHGWGMVQRWQEPDEVFLVRLEPGPARAFVKRAEQVLEAGRPSCPFCGNPIDPDGHLCVRANGFRRRDP